MWFYRLHGIMPTMLHLSPTMMTHPAAPRMAMASAGWWVAAVGLPSLLARRTLRRGQAALDQRQYDVAEKYFRKAAMFEPTREEATCLIAESLVRQNKPQEAISALDPLFPAKVGPTERNPPRRASFLLTVAYCMLRLGGAAQGEIAPIVLDPNAAEEEKLAAVQACLLAEDIPAARQVLETVDFSRLEGAVLSRARVCRAAVLWHEGRWPEAMEALPPVESCDESDQFVVHTVRQLIQQRLNVEAARGAAG